MRIGSVILSLSKVRDGSALTVKVLEVCELDALAHAEHICGGAEAVDQHPDVAGVQGCNLVGCLASKAITGVRRERVRDIGPRSDDRAENHQAEAQQGHAGDGATEPEHFTVCDKNNCQVLKDGVDRDAEELQCFAASVDHADEQERDREPLACLVGVELAEFRNTHDLECLDCDDADNALCCVVSAYIFFL